MGHLVEFGYEFQDVEVADFFHRQVVALEVTRIIICSHYSFPLCLSNFVFTHIEAAESYIVLIFVIVSEWFFVGAAHLETTRGDTYKLELHPVYFGVRT